MEWLLDPLFMSRVQFAFTISFHIIFPAITIGLAAYLMVLEFMWLKTADRHYKDIYLFWMKIFAVCFGIGVVSGITMPYQFGTNWAPFTEQFSSVAGPLLAFEVLTAFFLEASFLGIMLFGWGRVSDRMHFFSTCAVSIGTMISAFWILAANSWMQTPQGFTILENGDLRPADWIAITFNPSFPYRFVHMMLAAFLAVACIVGGVGAWYLKKKKHTGPAKTMFAMAMLMLFFTAPLQVFVGDLHGLNTLKYQPAKVAAMEGHWETGKNVPLYLAAVIDEEKETTTGISIPSGASVILGHSPDAEIKGLKDWPRDERPPVAPVFWSFRVMVGLGMLMIGLGVLSAIQFFRKKLFTSKFLQCYAIVMAPAGIVAILAGWFVTEIGRQPWTIYGVMRTSESVSNVAGSSVALSMALYVASYTIVFGAGVYYIFKLIGKGPAGNADGIIYGAAVEKHGSVLSEAFPGLFKRNKK
jgi:cytochrome d ubiquinol oxidase subunit I